MKKLCIILALFATSNAFSQTKDLQKLVDAKANAIEQKLIAWRRYFHEHPELGNQEVSTAAIIAKHLTTLGMEVKTGVAKTGVVAILKGGKPGPVVALRADMDGLPVVERTEVPFASKVKTTFNGQEVGAMHACGHDAHMAILMAAAEVLTSIKQDLKGTVKFIFQPAEEGPPFGEEAGAQLMIKEGVLENPKVEVIFGLHINAQIEVGKTAYRPGGMMAAVSDMRIIVKGQQAHGAYPWASIDPIVVSAQIINALQTIVSRNLNVTENAGVVTIGSMHAGNRSNIIPESAEMMGTVRTLGKVDEKIFKDRITTIATKTAEAAGGTAEVKIPFSQHLPVTYNDPVLTAQMLPSLQKVAGNVNVLLTPAVTWAEDFSLYQEKIPGFFFFLGGMKKGADPLKTASHHTPDFFIDESGFILGVKTLAALVIDYMEKKK